MLLEFLMWPMLFAGLFAYGMMPEDEAATTPEDPEADYDPTDTTDGVKSGTGLKDEDALYDEDDYTREIKGTDGDDSLSTPDGQEDFALFGGSGDDTLARSGDD